MPSWRCASIFSVGLTGPMNRNRHNTLPCGSCTDKPHPRSTLAYPHCCRDRRRRLPTAPLRSLLPPLSLPLFPLASSPCPTALGQSEEARPRASDATREPVVMRHLLSRVPHVSHIYPSPSLLSSASPAHMDQREGEPYSTDWHTGSTSIVQSALKSKLDPCVSRLEIATCT
jgi:hypothetical protein